METCKEIEITPELLKAVAYAMHDLTDDELMGRDVGAARRFLKALSSQGIRVVPYKRLRTA
jgi:hypothetical protein